MKCFYLVIFCILFSCKSSDSGLRLGVEYNLKYTCAGSFSCNGDSTGSKRGSVATNNGTFLASPQSCYRDLVHQVLEAQQCNNEPRRVVIGDFGFRKHPSDSEGEVIGVRALDITIPEKISSLWQDSALAVNGTDQVGVVSSKAKDLEAYFVTSANCPECVQFDRDKENGFGELSKRLVDRAGATLTSFDYAKLSYGALLPTKFVEKSNAMTQQSLYKVKNTPALVVFYKGSFCYDSNGLHHRKAKTVADEALFICIGQAPN